MWFYDSCSNLTKSVINIFLHLIPFYMHHAYCPEMNLTFIHLEGVAHILHELWHIAVELKLFPHNQQQQSITVRFEGGRDKCRSGWFKIPHTY